jgi:hypothetical protein
MPTEPPDVVQIDVTGTRADVYEWKAVYADGSELDEYGTDGEQHGWKDIDVANLAAFILVPQRDHLGTHVLKVTGDARPIFFRRRSRELNGTTFEQEGDTTTITVLGMQSTVRGVNVQSFTALYADGSVLVTNDPQGF